MEGGRLLLVFGEDRVSFVQQTLVVVVQVLDLCGEMTHLFFLLCYVGPQLLVLGRELLLLPLQFVLLLH